jgi:acyl-CoA synthetase (AMP-forming)/AMP-acid ligase II
VEQAASNPSQIAQIEGAKRDTEITFEQLLDLTDRVASKLAAEGIRPGSAVALGVLGKWNWVLTLSLCAWAPQLWVRRPSARILSLLPLRI